MFHGLEVQHQSVGLHHRSHLTLAALKVSSEEILYKHHNFQRIVFVGIVLLPGVVVEESGGIVRSKCSSSNPSFRTSSDSLSSNWSGLSGSSPSSVSRACHFLPV